VRIALVCPYAWDRAGGVQVHVGELARTLRGRGHATVVLAPSEGPLAEAGVVRTGRPLAIRYQGTVAPIAPSPLVAPAIRAALRSFRPDVVHLYATLTAPRRAGVVATFHAYSERSTLLTVAAPVLRIIWRRLDVRLAVSEAAASFVGSRFPGAVRVVPNGCDVGVFERATPPRDLSEREGAAPVLLWVARLDRQKGFGVALAAFELLLRSSPAATLIVAGEGPDRALAERVQPATRDRIRMLGAVQHRDLPSVFAQADVFVSPATGQESFGMTLVESMAAGVPVVASNIPGYREVVRDGIDGILVPPGDPSALAEAAARVATDVTLSARLRDAGRERARRYDWDTVVEEIEAAFVEAVDERGRRVWARRS
jgi:phosphatidyl-myo-inositol alpha-mannosyltransferase